jgi:hypothetical protein
VPVDTQRGKSHLPVPVTLVAYVNKTFSKTVTLYYVDNNIDDALIERMPSVLDITKGKSDQEWLRPLLALDIRVAYVNEKLSKTMVQYRANSISPIKVASIEHMHSVLDIK